MIGFIGRRLLQLLPVLLIASICIWAMILPYRAIRSR